MAAPTAPSSMTLEAITGGVRISWNDNSNTECGFEIWESIDGVNYTIVGRTIAGITTFDRLRDGGITAYYKVRAILQDVVSTYSNVAKIAPLVFNLTSLGNGTGVSLLRFEVLETVTATLSGTAKFYTNEAGTEGERSTWEITAGAVRLMYLKVPSGTATLTVKNVISKWGGNGTNITDTGWAAVGYIYKGVNHPSIEIDISKMTALTVLSLFGNNTVYGDMSDLTELTYIEIGNGIWGGDDSFSNPVMSGIGNGGCVVTGDISGMNKLWTLDAWDGTAFSGSINDLHLLQTIWIGGYNTIGGDIDNCPLLTFLDSYGSNTLTGDITTRTLITTISVTGENTIYGDITNHTNLHYLRVDGHSHVTGSLANKHALYGIVCEGVHADYSGLDMSDLSGCHKLSYVSISEKTLTAAQVNKILADIWVNKDHEKYNTTSRWIYLIAPHCAAPTGQGLTDAAALAAYRTPNNDGGNALWTVTVAS